jgi:hypothetical protein
VPRWEPESVEGDAWFLVFAGGIRLRVDREPLPLVEHMESLAADDERVRALLRIFVSDVKAGARRVGGGWG